MPKNIHDVLKRSFKEAEAKIVSSFDTQPSEVLFYHEVVTYP